MIGQNDLSKGPKHTVHVIIDGARRWDHFRLFDLFVGQIDHGSRTEEFVLLHVGGMEIRHDCINTSR